MGGTRVRATISGRWLLAVAAGIVLSGCIELDPPAPPPAGTEGEVRTAAQMINEHRVSIGCRPLAWDDDLAAVAYGHSADMAARGFYGHITPDGVGFTDRLNAAGVPWRGAGENIARTEFGAEEVVYLWLNSDRHRSNIENCRFDHHGLALVQDLWTHVFLWSP